MHRIFLFCLFFIGVAGCVPKAIPDKAPVKRFVMPTEGLTPAESFVKDRIQKEGIHVVHFWAPWCGNSINELKSGWYEAIGTYAADESVTFTFVTLWNQGKSARDVMNRYLIPETVSEQVQPDLENSDEYIHRRRIFLGLPVTWTPTTWVFHKSGQLAYAFNYGETTPEILKNAIEGARASWHHD
ncbi:MAG: thioredoxin [Bacteroidetes Order II. Incertae sedis bacterium]|nr:thioredoxin [Bacteroidetes Order II. bacterium]